MLLGKILTFIIGVGLGVLIVMYHRQIVRFMGVNDWAERTFGGGGTYTLWQLIGVFVVVGTILYVTGTVNMVLAGIAGAIGF